MERKREKERQAPMFSNRHDLFFWRVTLWLYRLCILCKEKVREINQILHPWLL